MTFPRIPVLLWALLLLAAAPCPAAQEGPPRQGPSRSGVLQGPFTPRGGHGWAANLPGLEDLSDDLKHEKRSTLVLYEDGKPLRVPHQLHLRIEQIGEGGYSHWKNKIFFSASDNTDPNTNGRTYSYRYTPLPWRFPLAETLFLIFLLFLAGCLLSPLILAWQYRRTRAFPWLIGMGGWGLGLPVLLRANLVPPQTWYGAALHVVLLTLLVLSLLATAFALHRAGMNRAASGWALRLPKAWGLAVALLLGLEIFFRVIPIHGANYFQPATKFFWPDLVHHSFNQYGFRDWEPLNPRPHNLYRVLVVGDSFVEGQCLGREEIFGRVLEREVNRRLRESGLPGRVEVLSWGRCDKNAEENVATITNLPPEIEPDLVILEFTLCNDTSTRPETIRYIEPPAWFKAIRSLFMNRLQSYALYWLYNRVQLFKAEHQSPRERLTLRYQEGFEGWKRTKSALGRLARWLEATGTDGLVVIFPYLEEIPDYPAAYQEAHRKVHQVLEGQGLDYLDLLDYFRAKGLSGTKLVISPDDLHPNALANRLTGLYLADRLGQRAGFAEWRKGLSP